MQGTGYFGRTGVFEVLEISEKIRAVIDKKTSPEVIRKIAVSEGFITLRECAITLMLKGATTFEEVIRVTGVLL